MARLTAPRDDSLVFLVLDVEVLHQAVYWRCDLAEVRARCPYILGWKQIEEE
jgi:hypothetical protein